MSTGRICYVKRKRPFPDEYVKLFTKIPSNLKREKKSWELWLKSYTQPFFCHIVSYLVAYYSVKPCYLY